MSSPSESPRLIYDYAIVLTEICRRIDKQRGSSGEGKDALLCVFSDLVSHGGHLYLPW